MNIDNFFYDYKWIDGLQNVNFEIERSLSKTRVFVQLERDYFFIDFYNDKKLHKQQRIKFKVKFANEYYCIDAYNATVQLIAAAVKKPVRTVKALLIYE